MFNFEVSGHQFGTILKSDTLTFQSASMYPSPVKYCSGRMQETRNVVFSGEKKAPGRSAPHRISEWGCNSKLFTMIQISKYPDIHRQPSPQKPQQP